MFISALLPVQAVETVLVGHVRDAGNGKEIENANVFFRHTKIGTTTNEDGFFYMRLDVKEKVKLTVSAVGYKKQVFDITPGMSAGMEVLLEENINALSEVVAQPEANPALPLMKQVRAHRKDNAQQGASSMPSSLRYFISDIQPRHLKKKLFQRFENGMIMREDSSYILPLPAELHAEYALPLPEHMDFYQPTMPLHSASFLSPLAAGSNHFYRFYLVDSLTLRVGEAVEKRYKVHFLPKNTFDPLLQGVMDIDSATYALRHIEAFAGRNTNVNYLTGLTYEADYLPTNEIAQESLAAVFDMAVKSDSSHTFPSLLAERKLQVSAPLHIDTLQSADSAITAFLHSQTPPSLASRVDDSLVQAMQDSMMQQPLMRVARWAGKLFYTGYIPTGTCIDIGKVNEIIRIEQEDKLYLGLPFRTNEKLWEHVSLGASVGYGFRDRAVKYKAEMEVLLPSERRHLLRLTVADRYAYTDVSWFDALKCENTINPYNMRFTTALFNGLWYRKNFSYCTAARKRELQVVSENDWGVMPGSQTHVESTISVQMGHQGYGNALDYMYYDQPSYRFASLRGLVRLGWHEQIVDFYTTRKHFYGKYPAVYLGGELGSYYSPVAASSSYAVYARLHMMVRQDIQLGVGGVLSYLFDAGMVFGQVPYPQLSIMNGNQGITYQPERFTLMNLGQYTTDKYMQIHVNWNGRGILFGRIPGIRYLRLHELVEAKVAYGGLSDKNRLMAQEMGLPNVQTLTIPYTEVGVGIGNILRFGELYSVWRLTHRDDPSAALWAMRFRLNFAL